MTESPYNSGVGGRLVVALDRAYAYLRARHPDIPPAVIVVGSDSANYGHYARSTWEAGSDELISEIKIGAEGLRRHPSDIFGTLVHEAAHGICHVRGINDITGGKYHNKKFKRVAEELGLAVKPPSKHLGHSGTVLPEGVYADAVDALASDLVAYRELPSDPPRQPGTSPYAYAKCACRPARSIQSYRKHFEKADIICGDCQESFVEQ